MNSDTEEIHCDPDRLKVKVRQSEDGRKKKIKIKNDFFKITIRVKDKCLIEEDDG